ncbi:uncharacterized protein MELLADRAFT_114018 [Melampsora larici-populina 98AG31]|uniref:Uncharacterized protein n=1 Tax=Melampsora larici-populina (strain 98AG31 / pathotype 3-4-7) TaxID=747676 RepID=F4SBV6_MELLP|nr:uncharacterized protein MELLADRAFT_114018 [Melampsora larici-populina 98AG31]EGF97877.1 hypothetical protein MELLADRAFT_114018 [Melampsora larici-populina 98AG31]
MSELQGIKRCEKLPLRCNGVFKFAEEIPYFHRLGQERVGYRLEAVVEIGLVTHVPCIVIDESREKQLQCGRWYSFMGVVAMENWTPTQHLFLERDSVTTLDLSQEALTSPVNSLKIPGRGIVLDNRRAKGTVEEGNYCCASLQHRQWDMTRLLWVEFTADYIYENDTLTPKTAALIAKGNVIDVNGNGIGWSDWNGGWIIKNANVKQFASNDASALCACEECLLIIPGEIYSDGMVLEVESKTCIADSTVCVLQSGTESAGIEYARGNNAMGNNYNVEIIDGVKYMRVVEYQGRGPPHVLWIKVS